MDKLKPAFGWDKALDSIVLLLWSAALLFLLNGGRYTHFLRPALGVCLAGALLMCLVFCVAVAKAPPYRKGTGRLAALVQAAVLVVPLVYGVAAGRSVLDSQAFATRWTAPESRADARGKTPSLAASETPDGGYDKEAEELFKSYRPKKLSKALRRRLGLPPDGEDSEDSRSDSKKGALTASLDDLAEFGDRYLGKRVITEGMVAWDKEDKERFYLFRFVIVCCVADAQPAAVLVKCPETERPAQNAWLRVDGIADAVRVGGEAGVIIREASLTPIPAPKDPYLY